MYLVGVTRHAESSQNNKFAISLQYFKKEVRDNMIFLHEDKQSQFTFEWDSKLS